jgi:predicted AAA+ superfamily ATPase
LEARTFNTLSADPQRLGSLCAAVPKDTPVIIDEIQKLPSLLDEVHRLIETTKAWFILTGSSARKLRRSGVNLLGGRAVVKHFHPLTAAELGDAFDLAKALRYGLLPTLYDPARRAIPDDYLQGYLTAYLKEEVAQEGLTRNLGAFSRFWEAASLSQGQPVNMTDVARECQIHRKLAESYFGVLEDLLIGVMVPAFQKRARRRVVQHSKFFLFDAGVFRAVRPRGPLDSAEETDGAALETLVLQHLRALLSQRGEDGTLSYWRTATGLEVDFVVYTEDAFAAIEVKRKRSFARSDLNGLKAFASEYPEAKRFLLYGGDHEEIVDGVRLVPVSRALNKLGALIRGPVDGETK